MTLIHGDCIEAMAAMEPESIDAICTDPPYGLEFMGKAWDKLEGIGEVSTWGTWPGQRGRATRMPSANANVRCRNCKGWKVGRATNKSKCRCDRPDYPDLMQSAGHPMQEWHEAWAREAFRVAKPSAYLLAFGGTRTVHRMTCAIEDAGWIIRDMLVWGYASGFPKSKASLKPAWEPIVMARKPGPLRMLAIDACRLPMTGEDVEFTESRSNWRDRRFEGPAAINVGERAPKGEGTHPAGRWPANLILTDEIFDGGIEGVVGGGRVESSDQIRHNGAFKSVAKGAETPRDSFGYGDSGTYSRFFLVPKASRSDREPVLTPDWFDGTGRVSTHPTVKPTDLMRHLVRLVTPTGGIVLDPFGGSGTTALACELEGFPWVLIEREAEYVAIAEARLNGVQRGLGLPA